MTENTVRLKDGQRWTTQQFLDHYRSARISGTPTPEGDAPAPVDVDRSWYMDEGPGRYYHPGMFPIIHQIMDNRKLAPGIYDLRDFVPDGNEKDPALAARLSNYTTDVFSGDHWLRSFVFGNESARISGQVVVDPDGSKMFKKIEIRPLDTNFDFEHNTNNKLLEGVRGAARRFFDPDNQGISYNIDYRGPGPGNGYGRLYDPFTEAQLREALKAFPKPGSGPSGLLPSVTGKAPLPYVDEYRQYQNQIDGNNAQASIRGAPAAGATTPGSQSSSSGDITNWITSLAGVNPANPTQPASPPLNDELSDFYRNDPAWLLQLRR